VGRAPSSKEHGMILSIRCAVDLSTQFTHCRHNFSKRFDCCTKLLKKNIFLYMARGLL